MSRYHCSHCRTTFPYTPLSRRQHQRGSVHRALVARCYQTPRERLRAEPEPCRRALRGECVHGDSCRYSHLTPQQRGELEREADHHDLLTEFGPPPPPAPSDGDVERFLTQLRRKALAEKLPCVVPPPSALPPSLRGYALEEVLGHVLPSWN